MHGAAYHVQLVRNFLIGHIKEIRKQNNVTLIIRQHRQGVGEIFVFDCHIIALHMKMRLLGRILVQHIHLALLLL